MRGNKYFLGQCFAFFALLMTLIPLVGYSQIPLYSRKTGNWDDAAVGTGTWSLIGHTGAACVCTPGPANTAVIGTGHTVTYRSATPAATTVAGITVNDTGGGSFVFGNGGGATSLTVTGDVLVNAAGNFTAGGTGTNTHTLTISGNLTNNNVFNLTGAANTVTFNNGALSTISGTGGTFSFQNFTMNPTGSNNVAVNNSILINGLLSFAADGEIVVNSTSNITLGQGALTTGSNNNRYIELDGTTGSASQLIKTSNGNVASWQILFPIGTATGGYTPLDMTAPGATVAGGNPTANSTLGVKAIYNFSSPGQMRRQFRLSVTGNAVATTTLADADFFYNTATDISGGDVQANYSSLWFLSASTGTWVNLTGTAPGTNFFSPSSAQSLANGTYFYAIGNSTAFVNVWYSYQSGVWNDPDVWTLDPSGTSLLNPLSQAPLTGDQVVILNGFTVNSNINNITLSATTIQGGAILDMAATTSNTLGIVSGSGLLRIKGTALPSGTYTAFVTAGTGGTVEYYDTGGTLSTTQTTYNNVLFSNSTNSAITFVQASNLTVNTDLNVTQVSGSGTVTWQINDATATGRTLVMNGDINVSAGGKITVGTGNSGSTTVQHALTMLGNITNNGTIQFYDPTDANYSNANYTSGAIYNYTLRGNTVVVRFSGGLDKTITCNNQTDFYRLIVNKGTGQQAHLTITSSNTANFRLFGPNNRDLAGAAPNYTSNNNLSLVNGTLELQGSINIPSLVINGGGGIGGGWPIPQNAALWMNSPTVTITATNTTDAGDNGRQIYVFGQLRVSGGTLNLGLSRGLLGGGSGIFLIEGGTVNTRQMRTTYLGSNNRFAYTQTGGTVNVGTTGISGIDINTYPRFALPYPECSFTMSGGTLNVASPMASGTANNGGILISAATSNINVTGGDVNVFLPASATNFTITSTASFYNLNVNKSGAGASVAILNNMSFDDNVSVFNRPVQPLVVTNNLTLTTANSPTLSCNNQNLTVGGNIVLQTGTTLTPGTNTISLNGSGAQAFTHSGTITSLNNVTVNKSAGILTLGGTATFPNVGGTLTLTSGTLNDGAKTLTVAGSIVNNATHTSTGAGLILLAGPTAIGGDDGTFGNLTVQTSGTPVSVAGDQRVTGDLRLTGAASTVLNIGSNNLTVLGAIQTTATFGTNYRIQTSGLHNAGGLTRQGAAGDLLFPFGSAAIAYTPATINITATTHGLITVRPVSGEHPVVTSTGHSVLYYWRVESTGYAGVTGVSHKTYTYGTATVNGTTNAYRAARYDPDTYAWTIAGGAAFNAGIVQVIPDFSFGINIDGEYTAGDNTSPFGSVSVFYSRSSGAWNVNTTWSSSPCSGPGACGTAVGAGIFPGANNPVVIGDLNNVHIITVDANNRSCGTLAINTTSTLNCQAFTGLNFGASTGGAVTGTGTLRISTTGTPAVFPGGDFTTFLGPGGGTVEWYGNTKTIPLVGPAPQNLNLSSYNNLVLNPAAGQTITLPATSLTIHNNLTQTGPGTVQNDDAARSYTIKGNMSLNAGSFILINSTPATSAALTIEKNLTVGNGTSFGVPAATGGTAVNTITISGNLSTGGTLRFSNGNVVNLTFTGATNTSFTGGGSVSAAPSGTTLNRVTVNKGTDQSSVLLLDVGGFVNATTSGWLTLVNGTFAMNNSNTFNLTSTAAPYAIPATARLRVMQGTVTVLSNTNTAADLLLNGALEINGGIVNIGTVASTVDNDIEYASAGSPTIDITGGTLNVAGAIRRPVLTLSGALVYEQTGGTVTVRGRTPNNTRGIFEIDNNAGSSFTLTGGTLTIERPTNGTGSYADLYLNPQSSNVTTGSTINIGVASATQAFKANVVPDIGNLTLLGTGAAQSTTLVSSNLNLDGTLTINSNATLNTNSLNVFIGGNLSGTGTYNGAANTTTFNGGGAQTGSLTTASSFLNMTVDKAAGAVVLSGTSPTITNLNILNGVLDVGALNLTVQGNVVNNSSQIGTGAVVMAGGAGVIAQDITSSGGSFTNLALAGAATSKTVTVNGNMSIAGSLNFHTTNRYLNIGSSLLTFGTAATITGEGSSAFIKTNGSASDLGVVKNWSAGTNSFTYALGTRTNYTPVTFTNLQVTTAGDLNVIPVDDRHPTSNTGSTEQILNYYWIVTRGATLVYNGTGSHVYGFPASLLGGSSGTLSAGYLDIISSTPGWETSSNAAISPGGSATTTSMTWTDFLNINLPTASNTYHYAVGTVNTLPNPIIPVYSRRSDANTNNLNVGGDWNDVNSWTLTPGGFGPVWGQIPYGNSVVITANSRINIAASGRISFITQVDGLLALPTNKVGHNLGILRGTGTMRMPINTFPAGNYTSFVASGGGTIEYVGPMTMNNRTVYNNLSLIGTGNVVMTNSDLTLNGNVTIGATATLSNTANNRNISMAGNWTTTAGGTFAPGTGTVAFTGTAAATVNGTTNFNNVTISKTGANVTLNGTGSTTVAGTLNMSNGNLVTSATHLMSIPLAGTITGGSANSYISGPIQKILASGSTFAFPLGSVSASRYRPATLANTSAQDTWLLQYVGANANPSFQINSINNVNIRKVSMFEYWLISRSGGTSSDLTLTYNTGSYIPNPTNIGTLANLRVVRWDTPTTRWDIPPGGGTHTQSGTNVTGTVTVTNVTSFSPFTFGSLDADSPLPVKWGPFDAKRVSKAVALRWITYQELNNDHFNVERSQDGVEFISIGSVPGSGTTSIQQEYRFIDTEASELHRYYYRIRQVDFDGNSDFSRVLSVAATTESSQFWVAHPNPLAGDKKFALEKADTDSDVDEVDVQVFSPQGVLIYKGKGTLNDINGRLDGILQESSAGVYLLQVSNGPVSENFRIVRR